MRKKIMAVVLLAAALMALGACGKQVSYSSSGVTDAFIAVVEDHASHFLTVDEVAYQVDQCLDVVSSYLEGSTSYEEADEFLNEALKGCLDQLASWQDLEADEELTAMLAVFGISGEEYTQFVNATEDDLYDWAYDLSVLVTELETVSEEGTDGLQAEHDKVALVQDCLRGYYFYYYLNYWFVDADAEQLAYLQENVISQIKSCIPEDPTWVTDADEAIELASACQDDLAQVLSQETEQTGEIQEVTFAEDADV